MLGEAWHGFTNDFGNSWGVSMSNRKLFVAGKLVPYSSFRDKLAANTGIGAPDPDTLPSDRIEPGWGNGVLDSYRSKLPTPPDETTNALAASTLLEMADTLLDMCANLRKLAATMHDPNEAA